jgi:hypothetical protein
MHVLKGLCCDPGMGIRRIEAISHDIHGQGTVHRSGRIPTQNTSNRCRYGSSTEHRWPLWSSSVGRELNLDKVLVTNPVWGLVSLSFSNSAASPLPRVSTVEVRLKIAADRGVEVTKRLPTKPPDVFTTAAPVNNTMVAIPKTMGAT